MNTLEEIYQKAEAHARRYKTFDLDRFMSWVARHDHAWHCWVVDLPVPELTRMYRTERYGSYQAAVAESRKRYTPDPKEYQ